MQQPSTWRLPMVAIFTVMAVGCTTGESTPRPVANLDFISGRVVSEGGAPEAGVWVIAESKEIMADDGRGPDAYRKIVVTDDEGRFVVPELPEATYDVWVRGYGLLDSKHSWRVPGQHLVQPGTRDLQISVQTATNPQDAAKVYPANYWYSMLELPPPDAFPGDQEYISSGMQSQSQWMGELKNTCNVCHQIGTAATRLPSREAFDVGIHKSESMFGMAHRFGYDSLLDALGDWGERIQAGETPPAPPRPTGIERNVVITQWEVADMYAHFHDSSVADRRNPDGNPYGPVYGVDYAQDYLYVLDPVGYSWKRIHVPTHSEDEPTQGYRAFGTPVPGGHSNYGEAHAHSRATPHNPMLDEFGRLWMTTRLTSYRPDYCPEGSGADSYTVYDPETGTMEVVPTCFGTHHLEFADGPEGRLWSCSLGWLDTNAITLGDPSTYGQAQGVAHFMVDTDGDGQGDTEIPSGGYSVYPSPDGSAWQAQTAPSRINRYDPATDVFETFVPPYGTGPRGITVDSNGVVWTAFSASGHLASFDRTKCAQTWGMGDQCPEGWRLWKTPGPTFQGFIPEHPEDNANADMHYYLWVDRHNASGFGENLVIVNGTGSDSLILFDQETEEFSTVRVPYPLQFHSRLSDARIDDPEAGWKGRGLWASYNPSMALHTETRRPAFVQIQLRPDPLAN